MEIKVKYLVHKRVNSQDIFYWQPKKHYLLNGQLVKCPFKPKRLAKHTNDRIDAANEATKLNKQLEKWRKGYEAIVAEEGTVGWLIMQYRQDERFKSLRNSTIALYNHLLPQINEVMGDLPIDKISRKAARAFCVSFRENPRKPSMIASMGRVLFNFARLMDDNIKDNPFEELGISKPKPRSAVWTHEMIDALCDKAHQLNAPSIALALQLGLDTAQRHGDIRALAWTNYNGNSIKLRQSKTGVWVDIPVMRSLKATLDKVADKDKGMTILIDETTGKSYTRDRLCHRFREICDEAGIEKSIQFRDLRRTSVVRLAEHGCTNAEIAAISGHSIDETSKILEVYLPRNKVMADNAIAKLEKLEVPRVQAQKSRK